jgi:hypothetical protein
MVAQSLLDGEGKGEMQCSAVQQRFVIGQCFVSASLSLSFFLRICTYLRRRKHMCVSMYCVDELTWMEESSRIPSLIGGFLSLMNNLLLCQNKSRGLFLCG